MPEYKWPTKVKRYGIECPYQRFLIVKYEAVIDWNGDNITTPEALDKHICEKMLPALKKRIDAESPESHYCRNINIEPMLANPAPHIEEARQIMNQQGKDAARTFLLDHINRHKKEAFEGWWTYLTEGNPIYAKSPAFQYLVLRPVIDSSDAKSTRSPVNPDAEALAYVYEGIDQTQITPTEKLLRLLCEFMAFGKRDRQERPSFGTACGWVTVSRDMDNAANRVAALSQGSGWCVASPSMAESYLQRSDFHLLLENGRPVAAIRTDKGKAVEIEGRGNADPEGWWPRILLYCAARALQVAHRADAANQTSATYRDKLLAIPNIQQLARHLAEHPAQIQFLPEEIADDENYRPVVETAWLACAKADPLSAALAPSWLAHDPKLDQMVIQGWRDLLNLDPASVIRMPVKLQHREDLAAVQITCWGLVILENPILFGSVPPAYKTNQDILAAMKSGWIELITRNPPRWTDCPSNLKEDPDILNARKSGWAELLRKEPRKWEDCPSNLKEDFRILTARKSGWAEVIGRDPLCWSKCPSNLKKDPDILSAQKSGWNMLLQRDHRMLLKCPRPLLIEMHPDNPSWFIPRIAELLQSEPQLLFCVPKWMKADQQVRAAMAIARSKWPAHWAKKKSGIDHSKRYGFFKRLPAGVRNSPEILKQYEDNWLAYCRRYPRQIACRCPPELLSKPAFFEEVKKIVITHINNLDTRNERAKQMLNSWGRKGKSPKINELIQVVEGIAPSSQLNAIYNTRPITIAVDISAIEWSATDQLTQSSIIKTIRQSPVAYEHASDSIRANPDILRLVRKSSLEKYQATMDLSDVPKSILDDRDIQAEILKFWKSAKELSWQEWLKCPDFIKSDASIAQRAIVPYIRALRNSPAIWDQIPSPWREMQELREEAAQNWATTPSCDGKDPPEDIRALVEAIRNS